MSSKRDKGIQLFILPYAGGSAASFKRLADLIDGRADVVAVEYAGHGMRGKEPPAGSFMELVDDAADYIGRRRDERVPYAVMGYSMGSVAAYEILAHSRILGDLKHFFICAEVSPKERALELRKVEDLSNERILARARSLGGLDERMVRNRRFAEIYLRPMLSDYRLFFGYRFSGHAEKIRTDATVFYCEEDTARTDVERWRELVDGAFDFHEMGENHFFINRHYGRMADVINQHLIRYL